jgi:fused signal recognition particle receptor
MGRSGRGSDLSSVELAQTTKKLDGVFGKLQRMESTLNDLRTESIRNAEHIKREIFKIKIKSSGGEGEGGTGGGDPDPFDYSGEDDGGFGASEQYTEQEDTEEALSSKLKTFRLGLFGKIRNLFLGKPSISDDELEELEALLISTDMGVDTARECIKLLKERNDFSAEDVMDVLKEIVQREIQKPKGVGEPIVKLNDGIKVVLLVGVNGVGKTTTTAKLAQKLKAQGCKVLMVAADTFRAAAVSQLKAWGERLDIPVVFGPENSKPQTVVFDAMKEAEEKQIDVVLIDTAGRLHNKSHLMQELKGIKNIVHKYTESLESLLVLDGSSGQNALMQAREFNEVTPLSGVVVTKLDGTPKGGIAVAIARELGIPLRYIGVGESAEDLRTLDPVEFVDAMFSTKDVELSAHAKTRIEKRQTEVVQ